MGDDGSVKKQDCSLCDNYLSCNNLAMARHLIESKLPEYRDKLLAEEYEALVKTLEHLGYGFPDSENACLLTEVPGLSKELVEKSVEILRKLNKPA